MSKHCTAHTRKFKRCLQHTVNLHVCAHLKCTQHPRKKMAAEGKDQDLLCHGTASKRMWTYWSTNVTRRSTDTLVTTHALNMRCRNKTQEISEGPNWIAWGGDFEKWESIQSDCLLQHSAQGANKTCHMSRTLFKSFLIIHTQAHVCKNISEPRWYETCIKHAFAVNPLVPIVRFRTILICSSESVVPRSNINRLLRWKELWGMAHLQFLMLATVGVSSQDVCLLICRVPVKMIDWTLKYSKSGEFRVFLVSLTKALMLISLPSMLHAQSKQGWTCAVLQANIHSITFKSNTSHAHYHRTRSSRTAIFSITSRNTITTRKTCTAIATSRALQNWWAKSTTKWTMDCTPLVEFQSVLFNVDQESYIPRVEMPT